MKPPCTPIPAEPGQPERYDYEYERNGTASIFMFCEPLAGRRTVSVKEQRTMIDWAHQVKHLLDVEYPDALSCDSGVRQPYTNLKKECDKW